MVCPQPMALVVFRHIWLVYLGSNPGWMKRATKPHHLPPLKSQIVLVVQLYSRSEIEKNIKEPIQPLK